MPANSQPLDTPISAVPTADGGFLVAEYGSNTIRKVATDGTVTRVAGNGTPGFGGDGGQARDAQLYQPTAAVPTADGGFLISELGNCVVRKVSAAGVISTVAGVGARGRRDAPLRDRGRRRPRDVRAAVQAHGRRAVRGRQASWSAPTGRRPARRPMTPRSAW